MVINNFQNLGLLNSIHNYSKSQEAQESFIYVAKSGIKIKKQNKGKFTDYCGGKVTDECIQRGKNSSDPAVRKRATFAQNARAWKHQTGGSLIPFANYYSFKHDENDPRALFDFDLSAPVTSVPKPIQEQTEEVETSNVQDGDFLMRILNPSKKNTYKGNPVFSDLISTYLPDATDAERTFFWRVASNEARNLKEDAKNPNSTARGIFQIIDSTWNSAGGGADKSYASQFRVMRNLYNQYKDAYRRNQRMRAAAVAKGYDPEDVYRLMHRIGVGGAETYLTGDWKTEDDLWRLMYPDPAYRSKVLASNKGMFKELQNIMQGKDYKA